MQLAKNTLQFTRIAIVALIFFAGSGLGFCSEIHEAAADGDLEKVATLLKKNPALVSSKLTVGHQGMRLDDTIGLARAGYATGFRTASGISVLLRDQ